MRCRYLGWAGVELEHDGETLVIDPLRDAAAVFAALGDAEVTLPALAAPRPGALGGIVTHLHRDHTDAGSLRDALLPDAPVHGPSGAPGGALADAGLGQARAELAGAGLHLREMEPWQTVTVGAFTITGLPAADGTGDPQLSWAVQAGEHRVFHGGDTMFHGWWWRMAQVAGPFDAAFLPVNGAVLSFPHRRPASALAAVMTPEQAAQAAASLGPERAVPMHYGAFDIEPFYRSASDAAERFMQAAGSRACRLAVDETLEL